MVTGYKCVIKCRYELKEWLLISEIYRMLDSEGDVLHTLSLDLNPPGAKIHPLNGFKCFKCTHQNQSSNTPYFDYVSTTNECIDLPYFATICQDMC